MAKEVKQSMLAGTYLRRFAEPQEIAKRHPVLRLAGVPVHTGQHLVVDGGLSPE
jgi:NAD(P)-dependent dehydrogenase (short-subunit alcohol dehydrogenase family)